MSTAEFGDPNLGQAPAPAPDALTPLTLTPPTPVEPQAQPAVAPPVDAQPAPIPASDMREVPLGTLIFREGLLTEEQLEEALQDGMQRGKRLGEVLLERGLVSENDLGRLLAGQKGLQFVQLDAATIDPAAVRLLSVEKARLHSVLPIGFQDGLPVVAVADPSNDLVIENVRRALNCEPRLVVAGREALHRQIELAYTPAAPVVAEPPPAPSTVVAEQVASAVSQPVAPVVVEPVAVQPVAGEPVAVEPVAETLAPAAPVVQPEPVSGEGVWLAAPVPVVETPIVEPAPVVQPEPVVHPEPVFQPEPVVATEPVPAPVVPEPVSISYEPVVASEPPVVAEPVFTPEPVAETLAPALEQPAADAQPETWYVVLRLADGERIDVGAFGSSDDATTHARGVVEQISAQSGWPFFEGRFLRPEAIVSVDLVAPEGRWLGSAARRQAWLAGEERS
jgi:Type II secretion system (T2SS), protein E, N-terminal domain